MKILGVCGGNGVLLYPLKKNLIGNIEIRSIFKTPDDVQWKLNFGDIPLSTKADDLIKFPKPDIIVGAPNCGHSSILAYSRAKKLSDPLKDESFELFLISIQYFKPSIFLMENLPKALEMVPEEIWYKTFPDYEIIFHKVSVSEFGNSQKTRIRLILIGINKTHYQGNLSKIQYHFNHIYKVTKLKTCDELLQGLDEEEISEKGHIREDISETITLYAGKKLKLSKIRDWWLANPKKKRWPVTDKKFTTAPGVYRNLGDGYPSVARKANRQFNDLGLQMSPRELARIQGVPNRFKIWVDMDRKIFSLNKGRTTVTKCPPYQIGKWFAKQIKSIPS